MKMIMVNVDDRCVQKTHWRCLQMLANAYLDICASIEPLKKHLGVWTFSTLNIG